MKRCSRCGAVKSFEAFGSHARESDGLQPWCRSCKTAYQRSKYDKLNKEQEPRKSFCPCCGKEFILLSRKRKYCSNNCRSKYNNISVARLDWNNLNLDRRMFYRTKFAAGVKGIPFNLELTDIVIPEFCPVLGLPLKCGKDKACDNSPSLDKIVPELGYVKGNVRVISQRANLLKSNATLEELRLVYEDAKKNQT